MNAITRKIARYWHTVRYLRPAQIIARLERRFKRIAVDLSLAGQLREKRSPWIQSARKSQRMVAEHSFCFMNETKGVVDKGDWNNDQWSRLWLYNLHYFDDLTAINAERRTVWHRALIDRWINENPPGYGNGWDPYPISLRIVNWIKWVLSGNRPENIWLHSLAIQCRFLSRDLETHLLGNHLFANAKALLFTGLFFEGDEAKCLYEVGREIVERELSEQVLADGGHFELSTMYHVAFLEDLLDLVNLHCVYGHELPSGLKQRIPTMFRWLQTMCHPDGEISFFNDAALGVMPSVDELRSYACRLSLFSSSDKMTNRPSAIGLDASGYTRVEMEDGIAIVDRAAVGPDYLPGHAHADTLSFELSLFGLRVVVNSGTSVYGAGPERQRQRGTAAHSTVVIDGQDSSEVWSGFRVARRAKIFDCRDHQKEGVISLVASHDGYRRLPGKPIHCREWRMSERSVAVHDKITGKGNHKIDVVFPLHPNVLVDSVEKDKVVLYVASNKVTMLFSKDGCLEQRASTYHPEFGLSTENSQLVYRFNGQLPTNIITRICW